MNILMICHKAPEGATLRSHAMGRQLVRKGHQVTLMVVSDSLRWETKIFDRDGVKIVETPNLSFNRLRYGWDAWDTLKKFEYLRHETQEFDLVHCFETRPSTIYPALWFAKKHRLPVITDWNDWFGRKGLVEINRPLWYRLLSLKGIETYYEEAFRAKAAGLTVISTVLAERAVALGVRRERICHVPGGTFLDWFKPRSPEECRRRTGFPLEIPILGFSSSDSHFDMQIVMGALAIVARRFPSVKLIVTGKARKSVHKLVDRWKVRDHVCFTGYVSFDDLPWYLGCADLFLLPMLDRPYNRGRWPNKMGEYLSLGRPTVANPVGDIKQLFERHPVGLVAGWDHEDFAQKIIAILSDPQRAAEFGRNARRVAETDYDWTILGERLEKFYRAICEMEGHSPGR